MLVQRIPGLGVHHLAYAFSGPRARDGANDGAGGHADRPGGCANSGAGEGAACGAHATGQVVILQCIVMLGIDNFTRAAPRHAAGRCADRCTGGSTNRSGSRAQGGARQCSTTRADAGGQLVFRGWAGLRRISAFGDFLACQTARNGANNAARERAEGPGDHRAKRCAGDRARGRAHAGADWVSAGGAADWIFVSWIGVAHWVLLWLV